MTSVIPKLQKLTPCVTRVLGCNPGQMTLQGTNTYLVGTSRRKLLIDTGEEGNTEYLSLLQSTLDSNDWLIDEIVITHWHCDHVGGVPSVYSKIKHADPVKVSKFPRIQAPEFSLGNIPYNFVKDKHVFTTEGATLQAIHTPGHTEDHMILLLKEENAVFSGDNVLGEGTTVMEDLYEYMKSLQVILELRPSIIYPGHGPVVTDPVKSVTEYIQHRQKREEQLMDCLKTCFPSCLTVAEIRAQVYQGLSEILYKPAEKNVFLHLGKLEKENRIKCTDTSEPKKWCFRNDSSKI